MILGRFGFAASVVHDGQGRGPVEKHVDNEHKKKHFLDDGPDRPVYKMNSGLALPMRTTKGYFDVLPFASVFQSLRPQVGFQFAGTVALWTQLFLLKTTQREENFCDMGQTSESWSRQQRSEVIGWKVSSPTHFKQLKNKTRFSFNVFQSHATRLR